MKTTTNAALSILYELYQGLKVSLRLKPFVDGLCTPLALISLALGFIGLFFTPTNAPSLARLVFGAFIEEITYRALLQEQLERTFSNKYIFTKQAFKKYDISISYACLIVAVLFAALHAITQTAMMSAAIFFPALVFGVLWSRFRSVWLCVAVHVFYNVTFFYYPHLKFSF